MQSFAAELCEATAWTVCGPLSSPLVWRELPEYGGRRLLIGGAGEFQEYACQYYGLTSRMSSCRMVTLAKQNVAFKQQVRVYDVGRTVISTSVARWSGSRVPRRRLSPSVGRWSSPTAVQLQ